MLNAFFLAICAALQIATCESPWNPTDRPIYGPVSIAIESSNTVLLANYSQLVRVQLTNGHVAEITKPSSYAGIWMPTGIFVSKSGNIYVANYKGRNLLILNKDGELKNEIKNSSIIGPENVAVNDVESLIAIADYDASKILLIKSAGDVVWEAELPAAHGVAFLPDGNIVASSLRDGTVWVFDSRSGFPVFTFGGNGRANGEFLYPTSIDVSPSGRVAIVDADLGQLKIIDGPIEENPKITAIGTPGGYEHQLNTPYGFSWVDDDTILVADTRKNRLALFTSDGTFLRGLELAQPQFSITTSRESPDNIRHIPSYNFVTDMNGEGRLDFSSLQGSWLPAYKRLWPASGPYQAPTILTKTHQLTVLQDSMMRYTYLRNLTLDGRSYTVVGSPQSTKILIQSINGPVVTHIGPNLWPSEHGLFNHQGFVSWRDIIQRTKGFIDLRNRLLLRGESLVNVLRESIGYEDSNERFISRLSGSLDTKRGKIIFSALNDNDCSKVKLKINSASSSILEPPIYLDELVIIDFVQKSIGQWRRCDLPVAEP